MKNYKKTKKNKFSGPLPVIFTGIIVILLFVFLYLYFGRKNSEKKEYCFAEGTVGEFALSLSEKYGFSFDSLDLGNDLNYEDKLSNEKLCLVLCHAIDLSAELSDRFVPVTRNTTYGKDTSFYQELYGNFQLTEKDTYDAKLYERQIDKISSLSETTLTYSSGSSTTFFRFDWEDFSVKNLFTDFDEIAQYAVDYVEKSLEYGLCPYFFSENSLSLELKPSNIVSSESLDHVQAILSGIIEPDFADSVKITNQLDGINSACFLSFSHLPSLFFGKMLSSRLSSEDLLFLDLDDDETSFALRFNCEYLGMVCLPLDFCINSPVSFIFAPFELSNPNPKLVKIASLFPKSFQEEFVGTSENILLREGGAGAFYLEGISFEYFKRDEFSLLYIGTNCIWED